MSKQNWYIVGGLALVVVIILAMQNSSSSVFKSSSTSSASSWLTGIGSLASGLGKGIKDVGSLWGTKDGYSPDIARGSDTPFDDSSGLSA